MTVFYTDRIQSAANYVVTDSGKILDATSANEHDRVLLEVMADPGNVRRYFDPIGQAHSRHFSQCRVRLLGCLSIYSNAYTPLLRTRL